MKHIMLRRMGRGAIVAIALGLGLSLSVPAGADEEKHPITVETSRDWLGGIPEAPTEDWEVAFGGRLYDNWAVAADVAEPRKVHPSYPPWGKQKGYTT
ncbi:MAG: hypothetical protein QGI13_08340 [Rhodospirillales bacterium]|nr:hypothetical protein [Rhodospirillales bacterium]